MPLFFGSSGQRVEQGASEARKRPGGAFGARLHRHGIAIPVPDGPANRAVSSKAPRFIRHRRRFGAFRVAVRQRRERASSPALPPLRRLGGSSAGGTARGKGGILSRERIPPLYPPRERQGRFDLAPAPRTTKREGRSPSFLDYPPRCVDGAALLRSPRGLNPLR